MITYLERYRNILLATTLAVGTAMSYLVGSHAFETNKQFGFPLDDSWIHLQFAKNLHDYGSFSYFKNEMVTAGSTSPLYTLLLSVGFFFTSNEMMLSYLLGVGFLLLGSYFVFKLTHHAAISSLAVLSPLLLLFEPRMQWAALSGMETTLFIALLLASIYFYQEEKAVPLGVAAGLLVWTRPEAIIVFIAFAVDLAYEQFWVKAPASRKKTVSVEKPPVNWLKNVPVVFGLLAVAYVGFNLALSGSILPNTFAAKLKYYGSGVKKNFPFEVFRYLTDGHMMVIAVLAVLSAGKLFVQIWRRVPQTTLVPLLVSLGFFFSYWLKLPYLYQEGRYLMPVIPMILILALSGVEWVVVLAAKAFAKKSRETFIAYGAGFLLLLFSFQFAEASVEKQPEYAEACKYISDRQVRTAKWLKEHTPANAIIGTHDIGAIAYYSDRRIADMVGLVSPEAIEGIGSLEKLYQFLADKKVTHLALLRNWFEAVNQNPIFKTDERYPEIMEVFEFSSVRTHLTPQNVTAAVGAAAQYLYQGQFDVAEQILRQAVVLDPQNSKVHHLLGAAFMATNRFDEALGGFGEALKLHPGFLESQVGVAQVAIRQGRREEGIALLETIARNNPQYPTVFRALADVYNPDSNESKTNMRKFEELMRAQSEAAH